MKLKVFSVYDSKAESFANPWYEQTQGSAIRAFIEVTNEKGTAFNKYPSDYTLFELGEVDLKSGTFSMLEAKKSLGVALEYLDNGLPSHMHAVE